jgi:hypothetical protein
MKVDAVLSKDTGVELERRKIVFPFIMRNRLRRKGGWKFVCHVVI